MPEGITRRGKLVAGSLPPPGDGQRTRAVLRQASRRGPLAPTTAGRPRPRPDRWIRRRARCRSCTTSRRGSRTRSGPTELARPCRSRLGRPRSATSTCCQIKVSHVEAWVKSMTVTGTKDRPRPLAPGTIKTRFVNVRTVFKAAVRDGMIAGRPDPRGASAASTQARGCHGDPARPRGSCGTSSRQPTRGSGRSSALCAFAGLRLGEAAALKVTDVDFLRREIHVRRQVQRVNGGEIEIRLPKYNSERTIHAAQALHRHARRARRRSA